LEEEEDQFRPAKEATTPKLRKEDKKDEDEKREPSSLVVLRFNREETLFIMRIYTLQFIK